MGGMDPVVATGLSRRLVYTYSPGHLQITSGRKQDEKLRSTWWLIFFA